MEASDLKPGGDMGENRGGGATKAIGLVLAGLFIVGLAVVTSEPFLERFAKDEQAHTSEPGQDGSTAPGANVEDAVSEPVEEPPTETAAADEAVAKTCCEKGDTTPPLQLVKQVPPGGLHNPYDWRELAEAHSDDPDYLVKQYRLPGCNECHGGGGGGGFCPALSQGVWFWGNTDDVLFRLIVIGSQALEKQGFERYQYGTIKGPMPEMGQVIKTSDHVWQIIAFIRSINPPGTNPPEKVIPGKYTPPADGVAE